MTNVEFVTVRELNKKATAIVVLVEKSGKQVVITKNGKPVALLQGTSNISKGRRETITDIKNDTSRIIKEIEKGGNQIIITRDNLPVALLRRISVKEFCIK